MTISAEERFINTLAADVDVLRLVHIAQLSRVGLARPEVFAELRKAVFEGVAQQGLDTPRTQDAERVRQLTLARTEAFFGDVETVMGLMKTNPDPSKAN